MSDKTDKKLMSSVRKGQPESFDSLYELCKLPIFNFIYQMIGDVEEAKDLTQESFVAIYKVLTEEKKVENLRAYLYTIARNKALLWLERRSREYPDEEAIVQTPDESYYSDPVRAARNRKQQLDIVKALQMMPERYREVFVLREQAGFSYDRIASMLDTNKTNVGVLLYRARVKFRELYRMLQVTEKPASEQCEQMLPMISSWLDGEATKKQERALQTHMSDCPFCRLASEQMVEANSTFQGLIPLVLPLAVKAGLMAKVGLAGVVPMSIAAGTAAGGGASASAAAAFTAGSGSAAAGVGAGAGVAGAATGLSAKAVVLAVTAVVAVAAAGGGTYVGVKHVIQKSPAAVAQVMQRQIREFMMGTRDRVDIPDELRRRVADIWQASEGFIKDNMPNYSYEKLKLEADKGSSVLVNVVGLEAPQNSATTSQGGQNVQSGRPVDCYLQVTKQKGSCEVEKMTKISEP